MLDSETRRRIDTARDILVGKVPDPKSQVEQITIALVYKFMDDMDKQSIEMGGKASFFKGEFKKYGWSNIFDPRLGGIEMLNLYGEAITRMSQNDNLPELFRNIFKNAFLPYRDPETLKLFLKTVNEFTYDHSEKLGDAFEYLLSVLGSQGDAGQFRTPRHIIDFMVQVLGPKKNETVLDPACGTAGFLISAYKYMVQSAKEAGKPLNAQDKKRIYENFTGYDISPDMVRLSLVNLYLHGFVTPKVHEYDTLTSEERWNDYADVILANPPFMSPKGGIQPHKRFSVQSNRSEVLFVDYMAEHLTPNGRAAIIVPEGIIFQSAGAYKQLRKYLVENNYLWAVVSLPAGVFNPYAGVKTSILFLDKALARKTDQILFVKVEADGFDLGAQRRPIERDDLPDALNTLHAWRDYVIASHEVAKQSPASFSPTIASALLVSTSRLAENEDYNLSADRYREVTRVGKQTYPMVKLEDICEINSETAIPSEIFGDTQFTYIDISSVENGSGKIDYSNKLPTKEAPSRARRLVKDNDVLLSTVRPNLKAFAFIKDLPKKAIASTGFAVLRASERILPEYLYAIIFDDRTINQMILQMGKGAYPSINQSDVASIQIPLPPLETQRQIVDEIAAHQRIIDGARQVVEGWKPNLELELAESLPDGVDEWDKVNLGDITKFSQGIQVPIEEQVVEPKDGFVRFIRIIDYTQNSNDSRYVKNPGEKYFVDKDDLVMVRYGATAGFIGRGIEGVFANNLFKIKPISSNISNDFLFWYFKSDLFNSFVTANVMQAAMPALSHSVMSLVKIPLPPLEIQREIVARIERERSIVEGNREMIRIYEEKVKKVIERVWES